jgi:hypothetical protein
MRVLDCIVTISFGLYPVLWLFLTCFVCVGVLTVVWVFWYYVYLYCFFIVCTVFLYCLHCVFVLFHLCIFILIRFFCTSVRTTANE